MARNEHWDIKNVTSQFACHFRCNQAAERMAIKSGVGYIVRHHGPRPEPNHDRTRVNYFVYPNGQKARELADTDSRLELFGKAVYMRGDAGYRNID